MANQSHQWGAYAVEIFLDVVTQLIADVAESPGCVDAIRDFRKRRFGDVQEVQAVLLVTSRETLSDVRWNGVRGLPDLRAQLETFYRRECRRREFVDPDEQIIGPLPCDQLVVSEIEHAAA